jgi:Domain of unknown function (DUF4129)
LWHPESVSRRIEPGPPGPRSGALMALVAVCALILAAAAVPEGLSLVDESSGDRTVLPSIPYLLRLVIAGIAALMVVVLILLRVTMMRAQGKKRLKPRPSRWRFLALLLVGVALWATFASYTQGEPTAENGEPNVIASPRIEAEEENGKPEDPPEYSESFGVVVGIFFVLALGAITIALLLLFRNEARSVRNRNIRRHLLEELEGGVDDLKTIDDPRAAVIACYSRMERVVELSGIEHRQSDTPFELLSRLLLERNVSETAARRLTELFEEAKFSVRPIDEDMRIEALEALLEVRSELHGEVPVGVP